MEGEGAATTKIQRTNGSANNSQPANKAGTNTSQNPRPRNTNNRGQQYQQKDGNKPPNFEAGARKNPANPRRGKKYHRGKAQGQQTQQGQQVQQVQQGQQSQQSQQVQQGQQAQQGQQGQVQDQVHVHAAQTQAQEHIQAAQLRAPSWSNIVSHHTCEPFVSEHNGYEARSEVVLQSVSPQPAERQVHVQVPQTHFQQSTDSQKPRHRAKGQKKVAQEYASKEEETDYNADAKIEAMQIALDKRLNAMQSKTERMKTLQEEILKIRAERDVKIEELLNEKAGLTGRLQQLRIELQDTDSQTTKLDLNVAQLKQDKIQKIRALEDQSRTLLNDKSN